MEVNFAGFYSWSEQYLNLSLESYKEKQLQRRIQTIMKKTGARSLQEYAALIEQSETVKKDFLDYITINVTEFFRNKEFFDEFEQALVQEAALRFPRLKIWSAASSTGAEAYSVVMLLKRHGLLERADILATDLDETILQKAKEGRYSETEIKNVSPADLKRYFTFDAAAKKYAVSQEIKQPVRFEKQDLLTGRYPHAYHAILCRNVTIYFKNEEKDKLYQKFSDALVPGGIFFIGATESIYRPEQYGFKKIGSFIYQKVEEKEGMQDGR